jgi:hypothetical protein
MKPAEVDKSKSRGGTDHEHSFSIFADPVLAQTPKASVRAPSRAI